MAAPEVSHGRGGAGNINPDNTKYVDGEVVRVGAEGSHGDGAFSTGRGGMYSLGTEPAQNHNTSPSQPFLNTAKSPPGHAVKARTGHDMPPALSNNPVGTLNPHMARQAKWLAIRAERLSPAFIASQTRKQNTNLPPLTTGAANIGDAGIKQAQRADKDLVPEAAVRLSRDDVDYHTGRGGAGNEHIAKKLSAEQHKDKAAVTGGGDPGEAPVGLADRLKRKVLDFLGKK